MADRVDILRRLDARIEEAEELVTGLTDLRDEFETGVRPWWVMENARLLTGGALDSARTLRSEMRIA